MTTYAPPARARWIPSHYRRYPVRHETYLAKHRQLYHELFGPTEEELAKAIEDEFIRAGIIGVDDRELAG